MTISATWPDHLLTLAEWDQLEPDESHRLELVEGVLVVVPKPAPMHQRAMVQLSAELNRQMPPDYTAIADSEVLLSSADLVTVRAPDVVVVPNEVAEGHLIRFDARDVLVVIEIVSPGSGRTDRVTKMAEYAEAGIEHYWVVELGPPVSIATFVLPASGGRYAPGVAGSGVIEIALPVGLWLDLDSLTRR